MIMSVYLYIHPSATVIGDIEKDFDQQVKEHSDSNNAHSQRFRKFKQVIEDIGRSCS